MTDFFLRLSVVVQVTSRGFAGSVSIETCKSFCQMKD